MKKMTLSQHFSELRCRILYVAGVFLGALVAGWYVAPFVQELLTRPLLDIWPDGSLLYTGLTDGLMIRFSLATLVALLVVLPVALWHLWRFVAPGLKKNEKKFLWPTLFMSPVLFCCGAAFAFFFLFPIVFKFFIELNQETSVPNVLLPAARDYMRFAIGLLKVKSVWFITFPRYKSPDAYINTVIHNIDIIETIIVICILTIALMSLYNNYSKISISNFFKFYHIYIVAYLI